MSTETNSSSIRRSARMSERKRTLTAENSQSEIIQVKCLKVLTVANVSGEQSTQREKTVMAESLKVYNKHSLSNFTKQYSQNRFADKICAIEKRFLPRDTITQLAEVD